MDKEVIDLILERNPQLRSKRQAFEALKPGAYCWHHSWGVGCIKRYDAVSNRVIIDFENQDESRAMDPVFCIQKLNFVDENHVLVEARKHPEEIRILATKDPCDLIVQVLKTCQNFSASKLELKWLLTHVLSPILTENQFKKWWGQVQKAMIKDPRIAVPKKNDDLYQLREEPILPEQEILEEFYLTRRPLEKIALGAKLYQLADSIDVIRNDLPQILSDLTKAIQHARQLTQAERLEGCWVRNDLARYLRENVEDLQPTSQSIILETENLSELAAALPHVYYPRFLDLLTRTYTRPEEWKHIILQLLRYSSGRLMAECINFLLERECEPLLKETLEKWLQEQSLKSPVLIWIIKHRSMPRYRNLLSGLLTPRLLSAIFQATDCDALNIHPGRRIPLAEAVNEDHDLIAALLQGAHVSLARDLAHNLLLNQGFDTLKKRSLMARFIRVFPELQSLTETKESVTREERLLVSQESLDAIRREYELLVTEKIPSNKAAIAAARELGDLRENSEYKMARQDQEVLLARKLQIEKDLSRAQVISFDDVNVDKVGIGTVVTLSDSKGKDVKYTILGAWDGDPKKNILSYQTPRAVQLLGKAVGDAVELPSQQKLYVRNIARWTK
ncbi:MAG: GreA/GreB family elongation factor [Puniceicoccales bacterium]|jgi:transcription elongation GreA/GreB family factor|nr:GreA/GreB family elongation factor [Puniceicoccales bacterium]